MHTSPSRRTPPAAPVAPRNALPRPTVPRASSWGYAYIVGAALLWATIGPAARFALRSGATLFVNELYKDEASSYEVCDVRGKMCF